MAADLKAEPRWQRFAEYCEARERNRREEAVIIAEKFIDDASDWPFEERKRFGLWLANSTGSAMERAGCSKYHIGGQGLFAPRSVFEGILLPMLIEWCETEPANPEPRFWLGLYGESPTLWLRQAMSLDPAHGPARAALADLIVTGVEYAQHELPAGYLGEPADDLNELMEAKELVAEAVDLPLRTRLMQKILALESNAQHWIELRDKLRGLDWNARCAIWQARPQRGLVVNS